MTPAGHAPTKGTLSFTDVDLTDTHTVSTFLTTAFLTGPGATTLDKAQLEALAPSPMAIFESALSAAVASDSTGTGTGTINWTLADLPVYLADFIPSGETLTLTYTVTVTDSQNATSTQNVIVTITGNNSPAVVWIETTPTTSTDVLPGDWNTGAHWETGNAPTQFDDAIIITNQLQGLTPYYPVTISAATTAAAHSLTMNDYGTLFTNSPTLINQGSLTVGAGGISLAADAIIENDLSATIIVGGTMEVQDQSSLLNHGHVTLQDGGDFGVNSTITNFGKATIELMGGTLNVLANMTNAGTLTVDAMAKLVLNGATVTGTGGEIDAATGTLDLVNATIDGGTLGGSGTIETAAGNSSSTLNGVTIASGTTVTDSTGTLVLTGAITDHGEIDATTGTLDLDNATVTGGTLGGGGTIETASGNSSSTLSGVTIASGSTVTDSVGTLVLTGTIADHGEIDATAGTVVLDGATVEGGTLGGSGTVHIVSASTINDSATLSATTVTVDAKLTLDDVTVRAARSPTMPASSSTIRSS